MKYITAKQIRGAHALMKEIGNEIGYFSEAKAYESIKSSFADAMDIEKFSLAKRNCNEFQIKAFMDYLKSIAIDLGIETKFPLIIYQDLERFSINCIKNLQCCVTGNTEDVEIHFIDKPVYNSYYDWEIRRYRRMALSAEKHKEIEQIGTEAFLYKYLTCIPVKCDYHPDVKDKYLERN